MSESDPPAESLPPVEGELDRALALVRFLRKRCPWDASRTPLNLVPHLLEEAHEVADAIRAGDRDSMPEELGDLLLNLAFQVVLGEEEGAFGAQEVADAMEDKMRRRHPHLFGMGKREDWEAMKARERAESAADGEPGASADGEPGASVGGEPDTSAGGEPGAAAGGVLSGLPASLDPLLRAHRIQDRVSGVGFDWSEPEGALEKVAEELEEVREALARRGAATGDPDRGSSDEPVSGGSGAVDDDAHLHEELGDLLFAVVNLVRLAGHHSDGALHEANEKFSSRFRRLEVLAKERGVRVGEATLEELDALWEELKRAR